MSVRQPGSKSTSSSLVSRPRSHETTASLPLHVFEDIWPILDRGVVFAVVVRVIHLVFDPLNNPPIDGAIAGWASMIRPSKDPHPQTSGQTFVEGNNVSASDSMVVGGV